MKQGDSDMTRTVLALIAATVLGPGFGLMPAGSVSADVLLIEEVRQVDRMDLPVNGMKQSEVRSHFGTPAKTDPPVGDPPITRWDYQGWSVYFEYDLVLYSVLHHGQVVDKQES